MTTIPPPALPPARLSVLQPGDQRQQILPSPSLVQGISNLLQGLQSIPDSPILQTEQPSPTTGRSGSTGNRLSSTDPHILTNSKIPILSTSDSSLESDLGEVFQPLSNMSYANSTQRDMLKAEGKALQHLRRNLLREVDDLTEDDVAAVGKEDVLTALENIKVLRNEYQNKVEDFLEDFDSELQQDPPVKAGWKNDIRVVGRIVKDHAMNIRAKKESVWPTATLSDIDKRNLEFQKASLDFQQLTLEDRQQASAAQVQDKAEESRILAETESNTFLGECSVPGDLVADENWEEADDETVSGAMRQLSKWQDQMTIIERSYRKFENMALRHQFPQEKQDAINLTYQEKKAMFDQTKENVQKEDTARGLFTLEPVKSDIIQYPTFNGLPSEDFLKFQETMIQRFRENKVRRKEQVAKLRECLKGAALGRVPDGVKEIEEAFTRLNEAFGNPAIVMAFNLTQY